MAAFFELTHTYEKTAPCTPTPGSGTSPEAVSAAIGALSPGTTYHFRVVAENAVTTTKGEGTDETFKTLAPPPTPPTAVTGKASEVTETSATLNATVNPNGSAVTKCTFEYGTGTSYGKTAPCTPTPGSGTSPEAVTAAIGALSPGTTYHFRVVAENATTKGEGADETFTTESTAVVTPPTAVTGKASAVTETSATLNATVNPNGSAVTKCTFEYGTTTSYGKTAPCTPTPGSGTSPEAVTAAIGALSPGTTYHFRVVAENAATTTKGEGADETFKTESAAVVTPSPSVVQAPVPGPQPTATTPPPAAGASSVTYSRPRAADPAPRRQDLQAQRRARSRCWPPQERGLPPSRGSKRGSRFCSPIPVTKAVCNSRARVWFRARSTPGLRQRRAVSRSSPLVWGCIPTR